MFVLASLDRVDYGYREVERKGNAGLAVRFFHYDVDPGGLVDSKGDPHFEASNWGHSDFYVEYNGRKIDWGSSSKILFSPPFIPRYAEVIGGTLYVVAGSYQFPYSEEFERRVLDQAGIPGYDMRDVAYWQIFEYDLQSSDPSWESVKGRPTDDSPAAVDGWSFYDLQSDSLAQSIIRPSDGGGVEVNGATSPSSTLSIKNLSYEDVVQDLALGDPLQVGGVPASRILVGTGVSDVLTGGAANEVLAAGAAADVVTGGGGADSFLFDQPGQFGRQHVDSIVDFNADEGDALVLLLRAFTGINRRARLASAGGKRAVKKLQKSGKDLVYDQRAGILYFNENGGARGWGDGGEFARLLGAPSLTTSDVVVL